MVLTNRIKTFFAIVLSAVLCVGVTPTPKESISTTRLAEKVLPSVVGIHALHKKGGAVGTGVLITPDGYILTCAHVVDGDVKSLLVMTYNGNPEIGSVSKAKLIVIDRQNDLAILKIVGENKHLHYARLGDSDKVRIGDSVMAVGFPLDVPWTVTTGIISGLRPSEGFLQTDASINPGNSGGPLFNQRGEVIGINARIATTIPQLPLWNGMGFSIEINIAKSLLNFIDMDVD